MTKTETMHQAEIKRLRADARRLDTTAKHLRADASRLALEQKAIERQRRQAQTPFDWHESGAGEKVRDIIKFD